MLHAMLKIVGGKHNGDVVSLITEKFLIGREQDCHLRPNSELVSRHHCVFTLDEYALRIRDLGSTNGTLVNDEKLEWEITLKSGDRVRVGDLDFEIVLSESEIQQQPAEAVPAQGSDTSELSSSETSYEIPVDLAAGNTTVIPQQQIPQQSVAGQPHFDPAVQQPQYETQQPGYYQQPQQPMPYPQQPMPYPQQPMPSPPQQGMYP
ncbi:MAG: FHA domain-containing protein, partial [Planctomycetes bacterium]|nr:FHA domain-containing protein [Planctomycetota bacterium]